MGNKKTVIYKMIDTERGIVKSYEEKKKPPRSKMFLNEWQSMVLERSFMLNQYPNRVDKYNLYLKTNVPVKNIKIWFQNRRAKEKCRYEEEAFNSNRKKKVKAEFDSRNSQSVNEFYEYYKY